MSNQIIPANQVAERVLADLDKVLEQEFEVETEREEAKARILDALSFSFFH